MTPKESERLFRSSRELAKITDPICEIQRGKKVYISVRGIEVEKRVGEAGTIYKREEFSNFSVDEKSLEILEGVANAVRNNQPILLEGPTDIGKTKAVELLSCLTNTRLLRISLSGQTDVSELIGKFVPASDRTGFEWKDGVVPLAMKWNGGEGCWLYLDELGAAEPQILVKLNPILEKPGRLVLTEKEGGLIAVAGPLFRVIASTNPPNYYGRQPFAPDFLRRFIYTKIGDLDEKTLFERLKLIFQGEGEAEKIARLLAEFHMKANRYLQEQRIARDQRQRFRFDFSDLVRLKEFMENSPETDLSEVLTDGVSKYYCAKLENPDEKKFLEEEFARAVAELHDLKRKPRVSKLVGAAFKIETRTEEITFDQRLGIIRGLLEELPEDMRQKVIPDRQSETQKRSLAKEFGLQDPKKPEEPSKKEIKELQTVTVLLLPQRSPKEKIGYISNYEDCDSYGRKLREKYPPDKFIGLETNGRKLWFPKRAAQDLGWLDNLSESDKAKGLYLYYSPDAGKIRVLNIPTETATNFQSSVIKLPGGISLPVKPFADVGTENVKIYSGKKTTLIPKSVAQEAGWLDQKEIHLGDIILPYAARVIKEKGQLPLDLRVLLSAWEHVPVVKEVIEKFGGLEGLTSKKGKCWEALDDFIETRKAKGEEISFASFLEFALGD